MSHSQSLQKEESNHFLLGFLLGGGIALLLATDRGREIIKELSESGIDALEKLEKKAANVEPIQEAGAAEEAIDGAGTPLPTASQIEKELEAIENNPTHPQTQNRVRRFFKGVKKK